MVRILGLDTEDGLYHLTIVPERLVETFFVLAPKHNCKVEVIKDGEDTPQLATVTIYDYL